ncbi:MAG: DUF3040 domain-containing protein [Trebonia sp.]
MSLAPSEQQRLTEIERRLRSSDPELAVMLARFTIERAQERPVLSCQQGSPPERRSPARMLILIATVITLIIACVAMAVTAASCADQARAGHGQSTRPAASVYSPKG